MLSGQLYGPSDLYRTADPWRTIAAQDGLGLPHSGILSDLAFANLPWRSAVRESVAHGHLPLWNRFVLSGSPLLGTAQAGVFHPATWLGLWLPVPLSWTFSCTFTLFLGLLSGLLFFRDFGLGARAALVGAAGWGFSTYLVFWNGWSVGPSTATFPLILLGLRRLAREPGRRAMGLTVAALWLSFCGGHPESFFHAVAAAGVYFLWELAGADRRQRPRAIGLSLASGGLALLLCGPQLFPLLEAIPHSAEYRARRETLAADGARQSVPIAAAASRLLPDVLPFAHGVYGRSPVDAARNDGSGMPIGYAGAVLFPLACLALARGERARGRWMFLAFLAAGLAYGASFPGLMDLTARLPGFALALNYRLVFLAGFGAAGLAALGVDRLEVRGGVRELAWASWAWAAGLLAVFALSQRVFVSRGLSPAFTWRELSFEIAPLAMLGLYALVGRPDGSRTAAAAFVLLLGQRFLEMEGTYPTLPASTLAPPLPTLAALPLGGDPARIVARGNVFRPNAAALYGMEDARGYESLVLDRFADTFPLWSRAQAASFNRVDDLASARPFLSLLNVRYAIGAPAEPVPDGWREQARGPEMSLFENPGALARAFVPRRLLREPEPARRLAAMAAERDFADEAFLGSAGPAGKNGEARLRVREAGSDLVVEASVSARAFVATSLSDWPGWVAESGGRALPLETVNHAFVGFWLDPGEHRVRLAYRPASWTLGLAAFAAGCLLALGLARARRR